MERILGRWTEQTFALMRLMTGLLFAFHGTQKLFGWPGDREPVALASLRGIAGVIELVGGSMIASGFLASYAAFIASGTMAYAYFSAHADDAFFPIVNRGELAVVYCFLFLFVAARGSGAYSVDAARRGRARRGRSSR